MPIPEEATWTVVEVVAVVEAPNWRVPPPAPALALRGRPATGAGILAHRHRRSPSEQRNAWSYQPAKLSSDDVVLFLPSLGQWRLG